MSNISARAPLYFKVYSILKNKIEDGEFNKGDLLPTETELQKIFNVSRITVRKSVEMLAAEGFVVSKQGKGTEVIELKTTQKLNFVTSFTETLLQKGYNVSSKNIQVDLVKPPSRVASELTIDPDEEVIRIYRIRLANDKPIAIMINYLPAELVIGIEKKINHTNALYQLLEEDYNITIDHASENIGARSASVAEAEILQISPGAPLLTSRRVTYSNGKPIEVASLSIVADKYEYNIYMKGRRPL